VLKQFETWFKNRCATCVYRTTLTLLLRHLFYGFILPLGITCKCSKCYRNCVRMSVRPSVCLSVTQFRTGNAIQ